LAELADLGEDEASELEQAGGVAIEIRHPERDGVALEGGLEDGVPEHRARSGRAHQAVRSGQTAPNSQAESCRSSRFTAGRGPRSAHT
jgi:hypothetical protein